jgi:ElaB/YqjD/DUF883 family membrane-anchored ribosome-binding protein
VRIFGRLLGRKEQPQPHTGRDVRNCTPENNSALAGDVGTILQKELASAIQTYKEAREKLTSTIQSHEEAIRRIEKAERTFEEAIKEARKSIFDRADDLIDLCN